jgi:hypothetical protein
MITASILRRGAEIGALLFVLGLAAWLRLGNAAIIEFKRDEANLARLALDLARGQSFPLLGIGSSVGLRNAPFSVYVVTPPFVFSSDPIRATQYIGALNVLAVGLLYGLARRYYGTLAAMIAALCLAASPWAVIFSRKLWAQDALMPFIVLTVGSGLAAFVSNGRSARLAQLLHLPLLSLTVQIHFAAIALVPITLYLIWQGRARLRRSFAISLLLTALTVVPYAIGTLGALRDGTWAGVQLGAEAANNTLLNTRTLEYALIVLSGADLHSLAGPQRFQEWLETLPSWTYSLLHIFGILSLACGVARLLIGMRAKRSLDIALGLWLIAPLAIFSIGWVTPQLHYMIPLIPAAFLALGATLQDLTRRLRLAAMAIIFAVSGIAALQSALIVHLLSFLAQVATPNGFGTPLGMYMPIRAALLAQQPADVIIRADGQFIGIDDEATVWDALLYDLPNRRFLPSNLEVFPEGEALMLIMDCAEPPEDVRYAMRPLPDGTPERCFRLSRRRAADLDAERYAPHRAPLSIGGGLEGFAWDAQKRCLELLWRLPGPASTPFGDQFHTALALYAEDGTRLTQADGQFWLGRFWRSDDRVVSRHCLPELAAAPAYVQIGLYAYRQGIEGLQFFNLPWQDGASEVPFYRFRLEREP